MLRRRKATNMDLNERSRGILKAIINSYIATAEPVGSRTITKRYELGISPATVRNIMADLEEMGFLAQPHTSAGRVPTGKAYRFYIDTLLEVRALPRQQEQEILNYPLYRSEFGQLMKETTKLLSSLSHYVGVVKAPKPAETVYRHVEFVPLSGRRALAVFVSNAGIIHNRMVVLDPDVTARDLERANNFLSRELSGKTLKQMRARVTELMDEDRGRYSALLTKVVEAGGESTKGEESEGELYVGGMSEFFDIPDFRDLDKMREIFHAFEEKHMLVKLLDIAAGAEGVQVFIGAENPYFDMEGVSVVVASYRAEGDVMGTLGVIGPSRMRYQSVIPIVDCTAKVLSRLMSER